jgi:hypothetical protein
VCFGGIHRTELHGRDGCASEVYTEPKQGADGFAAVRLGAFILAQLNYMTRSNVMESNKRFRSGDDS